MIAVHAVLDLKFPVRTVTVFMDTSSDIEFANRREVDEEIDLFFGEIKKIRSGAGR